MLTYDDTTTVDVAPPPRRTTPEHFDDNIHSGLFWGAVIALLIGALVIGASRVWTAQSTKMVTFPLFNQTATMSGTVTLHVDADSFARLQTPAVQRFEDVRRTQTPGQLDNRALLLTSDSVTVDGTRHASLLAQYLLDSRTLKHVASPQAWAFAGGNVADRSSAYAINLPFDTGPGPYPIWLNEADRAYAFTQVGEPFDRDGVTLIRLRGHLDATPVDPQFVTRLGSAGLPAGFTLRQLQAGLASLPANLSGDDVATLSDPVPLDYTVTADTDLLVEPRTGTLVAVEKMDESFTAHLDATRLAAVSAVLDRHRSSAGVTDAAAPAVRLGSVGEIAIYDLNYAQTEASVKTMSDYALAQRDWMNRMTRVIPMTLLVAGAALMGLGVLAGVTSWRRRTAEYADWWEDE
jgi:hypothetical protein